MHSLILILFSVTLHSAAMPAFGYNYVAWVAFVPLFSSIKRLKPARAALNFFIFSNLIWMSSTWWFVPGMKNIGQISVYYAGTIYLLQCLIASVPYACVAFLFSRLECFNISKFSIAPAALFSCVFILIPATFPGNIAYSQYNNIFISQLAALGGTPLILFFIILINILIFQLINACITNGILIYKKLLICTVILIILHAYGYIIFHKVENIESKNSKFINLTLIQPNIPINTKINSHDIEKLIVQTKDSVSKHPDTDLVIWPEIPASFSVTNQPDDYFAIKKLLPEIHKKILILDFYYEKAKNEDKVLFYNTARLISDSIENAQVYSKNILIPFGEYIPFLSNFPYLKELIPDVRTYQPSGKINILRLNDEVTAGIAICIEAIYSDFISKLVALNADLIINPGDDAYFGNTSGSLMHTALSYFRSIEYRIPFVRVNNSGITQIFTASGKSLIADNQQFTEKSWTMKLGLPGISSKNNPGNNTLIASIIILLIKIVFDLKFRRAHKENQH